MFSGRFHLLDAIRGAAAIAVMVMHFSAYVGDGALGGIYVAVDLFFMLSGFVLAHAYGERILSGLGLAAFTMLRLRRLAPVYLCAILLALVATAVDIHVTGRGYYALLLRQTLPALLGLPWFEALPWPLGPGPWPHTAVFPIDLPRWSLFFELVGGVALHLHLSRLRRLPGPVITGLLWMVFWGLMVASRKANVGFNHDDFLLGFPRVLCEFALGALIFSLHDRLGPARPRLCAVLLGLACLLMLLPSHSARAAFDAALVLPLCLLFASNCQVPQGARASCSWLGRISYPLYLLHTPVWGLMADLTQVLQAPLWAQQIVIGGAAILSAELLSRAERRILARGTRRPEPAQASLRRYG